jgi:hypothetical protein
MGKERNNQKWFIQRLRQEARPDPISVSAISDPISLSLYIPNPNLNQEDINGRNETDQ